MQKLPFRTAVNWWGSLCKFWDDYTFSSTRWTNSKLDFINGLKWKKSEMIYRLHACIFKNTKKDLHFKQNCVISVTRFDTFNIWKKYKFFFSKFLKKFLEIFFWNVVFWLPNKDFRPLKKKIFFEKNLFYNLKYFFKCRMCQIWSLKWHNFV